MSRMIARLAPDVACQIAAGEVIERPVSVLKELLENALDANATEIHIEILEAGLKSIQVSDNGIGIWEEDLILAIEPHATSKISKLADIYAIQSKGFRGEALASMASVAKIEIVSKPKDQAFAMQLQALPGSYELSPAVRADGTSMTVRELFFNVPVRKKFLKTHSQEWQAIESYVKRFMMLAPHVHLSLKHNHELIFDVLPAHDAAANFQRILKLWGKSFETAKPIDIDRSGLRLYGWLGAMAEHRSQHDRLWIYLNGRIVQDKLLIHAIKQAYLPICPPGRHLQCLLYLETPLNMVDINVHPAKLEVRFEEPRLIFDFILMSLKTIWQASKEEIVALHAWNKADHLVPDKQVIDFPRASKALICNADFIILPLTPYLYLVDVQKWWAQQMAENFSLPKASRQLLIPFIADFVNCSEEKFNQMANKAQEFGLEMQSFGSDKLCIRAIPDDLPQFNIRIFVKNLSAIRRLEELNWSLFCKSCQFSSYDLTESDFDTLTANLIKLQEQGEGAHFAKVLDLHHCRQLFL
ncbi:MAG: DNA mismatch repair endonuclease MutL [Gammaproteobacteria bacterium]|nr:DNA mismatch repair endonuclease MutL [Gammaproteobacteria bacterium]